jgi:TPR repeat protein
MPAAHYVKHLSCQSSSYGKLDYDSGLRDGGRIDLVGMERCFELSADQSPSDEQFAYGECLRFGKGVPINLVGAARYFKLAAHQNHSGAQFSYGGCLRSGQGVPVDLTEAAKYFKLAVDQNDSNAQFACA